MSPGGNSRDPAARARSLANLKRGANPPARGNGLARRHGGYARVAADREQAKVTELREALGEDAPLRSSADEALLSLAARALARLEDVERYHDEFGWRDAGTGQPRPSVELERRLRQELADHLDALGMSPRSRARLGLDLARSIDLATAMSEPDPGRRAALMAEAGFPEAGG